MDDHILQIGSLKRGLIRWAARLDPTRLASTFMPQERQRQTQAQAAKKRLEIRRKEVLRSDPRLGKWTGETGTASEGVREESLGELSESKTRCGVCWFVGGSFLGQTLGFGFWVVGLSFLFWSQNWGLLVLWCPEGQQDKKTQLAGARIAWYQFFGGYGLSKSEAGVVPMPLVVGESLGILESLDQQPSKSPIRAINFGQLKDTGWGQLKDHPSSRLRDLQRRLDAVGGLDPRTTPTLFFGVAATQAE